jgi:YggT family protein
MGFKPNLAPLLTILFAIFAGLTVIQVVGDVLFVISGVIGSASIGAFTALIGYLLFGVLSLYSLMILLRIVFDWLMIFRGKLSRFLFVTTEPVLAPFRRIIPRIGMFDISPIVVFLLISIVQRFVVSRLISTAFM